MHYCDGDGGKFAVVQLLCSGETKFVNITEAYFILYTVAACSKVIT